MRAAGVGAVAGAATAVGFTWLHDALISDIWFSVVPMTVAGALCGASLAWTHHRLFPDPSPGNWSRFVLLHLGFLLALGGLSLLLFDPVTSVGALLAANEPPRDLIVRALPLTGVFVLAAAGAVTLLWGRRPGHFAAALVTSTLLVVLLGLNVSVLGLVEMSEGGVGPVVTFFVLLAVLLVGFGALYLLAEGGRWRGAEAGDG